MGDPGYKLALRVDVGYSSYMTRNENLTAAQVKALKMIAENPRKVEAVTRVGKGMLRINGNVENKLYALGLIRKVPVDSYTVRLNGQDEVFPINAWEII